MLLLLVASAASAQYSAPRIFFSDLQSAPAATSRRGAIVTVYGKGFGSSRGTSTVSVGGGAAARYLTWSDTKIAFQMGSSSATGNITVNVAGAQSNGVPFTVRTSGRIFYVSTSGSDSNSGSSYSPWATLRQAKNTAAPGDIIYVMDGVTQTSLDASSASLSVTRAGSNGLPIAIVAYPGARVTIGSASGQPYGVRASGGQWVLAGLTLRGATSAVSLTAPNWRLVGNDISCPNGAGQAACVQASNAYAVALLGNYIHDSGSTSSTDVAGYDSVAFRGSSRTIEVGWNEIANTRSCRALQFSSTGATQYGLKVHDNYIHDAVCSGISFENVNAASGEVRAYNNVVKRVGTGPAPGGAEADSYACISVGPDATTAVKVTNNTLYDCGARANGNSGAIHSDSSVLLMDNIVWSLSGQRYVSSNSNTSAITGDHNLFNGAGAAPSYLQASVAGDPRFVNLAGNDFRLQSSSPAINRGAASAASRDRDGVPRPQGSAFDIGAYEFSGGTTNPGTGRLAVSPATLSFGTVTVGGTSTQSVTLSNSGTGSATITQASATNSAFRVSGLSLPLTLSAGQSVSFTVTFAPTAAGAASATVSLTSNAENSPTTIGASGTGASQATGALTANPTSISFGNVAVGSSATRTVTLTAATAPVTLSQATASGTGFSVTGPTLPVTLSVGQTATFTVRYAPTAAGAHSGSVSFASNAGNTPARVTTSGTGTTSNPTPHSVTLTWNASTSSGISGYSVYRGTQSGGTYTKITSSLVSGLTYTDSNVVAGTTYYYVVTATSTAGAESGYSSQVSATIPTP